jgi:hypothetical protein
MTASTIESEYLDRTAVSALVSNSAFLTDFSELGSKGDFANFLFEAFIRFAPAIVRQNKGNRLQVRDSTFKVGDQEGEF